MISQVTAPVQTRVSLGGGDTSRVKVPETPSNWCGLGVLCLGFFTIAINATSANLSLASIAADLQIDGVSIAWVTNAYLIGYGGCLLLGGRLGDIFGSRRTLIFGMALFTLASLGCGFAGSPGMLIASRALQGIGGSVVPSITMSFVVTMYADGRLRAKALGIYAFVGASGGGAGLVIGGVLTGTLGWRWNFVIDVLLGIAVCMFGRRLLPRVTGDREQGRLDFAGAAMATVALMLSIYALVSSERASSGVMRIATVSFCAAALFALFLRIESRVRDPLVPLSLFRRSSFAVGNLCGALLGATVFGWTFITALYLQRVQDLSSIEASFIFLPGNLASAAMSLAITPVLVARYGPKRPLVTGMLLASAGFLFLAYMTGHVNAALDFVPGMLLAGLGIGTAYSPIVLAACSGIEPRRGGAASGILNTSFAVGGSMGIALLAGVMQEAGYGLALAVGATFAAVSAALGGALLDTARISSRR